MTLALDPTVTITDTVDLNFDLIQWDNIKGVVFIKFWLV